MGINVMSTGYYPTGFTNNKATKAETGKGFAEIASQKSAQADKEIAREKSAAAFDAIGAYAPDEVKQAWIEAEEETGTHITKIGLYITYDGEHVHGHITQMMVERFVRWFNGEVEPNNILGNSVESAISCVEKCIYDIDHPLAGQSARSVEVHQQVMKERAFYEAFLEKLKNLSDAASKDSQNVSNYAFRTYANIVPQQSVEADKEVLQVRDTDVFDAYGANAPDEVRQAWKEAEEKNRHTHCCRWSLYKL